MSASGVRGASAGFTLMETLVMLVLVSMAATMMFQMLNSYRIAQQRVAAQAGQMDRSSLFEAWLVDGVRGLRAEPAKPFIGSRSGFEGVTLNPLYGSGGAPSVIKWQLRAKADGGQITYAEDGKDRWSMPLRDFEEARFVYFDREGKQHDQWPPAQGLQESLPAGVGFVRGTGAGERVRLGSVLGPLIPRDDPFELEPE
ncbi:type II secretion system protein [Thermomonas sp.]